jgi:hypothetical protein
MYKVTKKTVIQEKLLLCWTCSMVTHPPNDQIINLSHETSLQVAKEKPSVF